MNQPWRTTSDGPVGVLARKEQHRLGDVVDGRESPATVCFNTTSLMTSASYRGRSLSRRASVQRSLMAVALAVVSMAAAAVIIGVFAVAAVVVATTTAAIRLNDAGREPEQGTGKNNNQSHCHGSLHQVEFVNDRNAPRVRLRIDLQS
jgi:hypothetical protein